MASAGAAVSSTVIPSAVAQLAATVSRRTLSLILSKASPPGSGIRTPCDMITRTVRYFLVSNAFQTKVASLRPPPVEFGTHPGQLVAQPAGPLEVQRGGSRGHLGVQVGGQP